MLKAYITFPHIPWQPLSITFPRKRKKEKNMFKKKCWWRQALKWFIILSVRSFNKYNGVYMDGKKVCWGYTDEDQQVNTIFFSLDKRDKIMNNTKLRPPPKKKAKIQSEKGEKTKTEKNIISNNDTRQPWDKQRPALRHGRPEQEREKRCSAPGRAEDAASEPFQQKEMIK